MNEPKPNSAEGDENQPYNILGAVTGRYTSGQNTFNFKDARKIRIPLSGNSHDRATQLRRALKHYNGSLVERNVGHATISIGPDTSIASHDVMSSKEDKTAAAQRMRS